MRHTHAQLARSTEPSFALYVDDASRVLKDSIDWAWSSSSIASRFRTFRLSREGNGQDQVQAPCSRPLLKARRSLTRDPQVLTVECQDCTPEDFDVLFKMMTHEPIAQNDVSRLRCLIQRYGLGDILACYGLHLGPSAAEGAASSSIGSPASSCCASSFLEEDVIVCGSPEKTSFVCSMARRLGLPYVPFRFRV